MEALEAVQHRRLSFLSAGAEVPNAEAMHLYQRLPAASPNAAIVSSVSLYAPLRHAVPCCAAQGLLNISSTAADYIEPADFGMEGRW